MIDPHVHLRDWKQSDKETLEHGLNVAIKAGLDGVFEMPNTSPSLTNRDTIEKRITQVDDLDLPIFHGIYGGLTSKQAQLDEIIERQRSLFPRVVGLKLYAGESTGTLSIEGIQTQQDILSYLCEKNYRGVLTLHCEEVKLFKKLYNPVNPITHCYSRPPESETTCISRLLSQTSRLGFKGHLHFCHISVPDAVDRINEYREKGQLRLSCGVTPHHAYVDNSFMDKPEGYLWKMNPPLREKSLQQRLFQQLLDQKIDWIETDHAPHLLAEKKSASGIPGLPFYPYFIEILRKQGLSNNDINILTHENIEKVFQIDIPRHNFEADMNLFNEYEYNPFSDIL